MEDELLEELEIRETIDGLPVDEVVKRRGSRDDRDGISMSVNGNDTLYDLTSEENKKSEKAKEDAKVAAWQKKKGKPDPYIWGLYLGLLMISVVELFSASSTEVSGSNVYGPLIRHGIFLLLGFGIVLWLQRTPYTVIGKLSWTFAIVSLGLLVVSNFIGVEINGAQRAIKFAGITIQPAEIVKLAVVCLLATILGRNQTPGGVTNKGVIMAAIVVIVFSALLWRNGLTNTLLLMAVSICMMVIGGIQMRKLAIVLGVYIVAGAGLIMIKYTSHSDNAFDKEVERHQLIESMGGEAGVKIQSDGSTTGVDRTGTQKNRISRHLKGVSPNDPITDENRQVMMAKFSQAHGGLMGQGPGNSRESARLPLAFSDYIYSIIVEDTGFVGGTILMVIFVLLLLRAGRIAYNCSRALPAFLILGCAMLIVFQALVHMAIVTGVFPVSGQPLPFISKGGTSVLVMSMALGIMLSVARFAAHGKSADKQHIRAEKNALPEDMQAANFSANR